MPISEAEVEKLLEAVEGWLKATIVSRTRLS